MDDDAAASGRGAAADPVDAIRAAWLRIAPDVDTSPIDVVYRVLRSSRHIVSRSDEHLAGFGLSRPEFDLLTLLRRSDAPLSPTRLADHLLFTAPATTKRLTSLESRGLVNRVTNPDDRRGQLVQLTAAGIRLIDDVFPAQVAHEAELLAPLTPAQQRRVASALRELLAAFE